MHVQNFVATVWRQLSSDQIVVSALRQLSWCYRISVPLERIRSFL